MPSFYDTELEEQRRSGKVTNIALPILAALEAIGTSIATKGRNPTSNALGIYKDVQSGREAALERALGRDKSATEAGRQDKIAADNAALTKRRIGLEDAEFLAKEDAVHRAVVDKDRLKDLFLGTPTTTDEATNTVTMGRKGLFPDATAQERAQIETDPQKFAFQKDARDPLQDFMARWNYQIANPKPIPGGLGGQPKAPSGYRYAADGALEAIPGGPADPKTKVDAKPPTEDQSKAANFARRMELALSDLSELEAGGFNRASSEASARSSRFTPNFLNTKEGQRYSNAESNFASANLRKESGAVITPDEMRQQESLYFPRHGDTPETIEQKERNRAQAFEGMKAAAGPLFDRIPSMVPAKAPSKTAPSVPNAAAGSPDPKIAEMKDLAKRGSQSAQTYLKSIGETW